MIGFKAEPCIWLLIWILVKVGGELTGDWAVEIHGGAEEANSVAGELGFVNLGPIGPLSNKYHFQLQRRGSGKHKITKRSAEHEDGTQRLTRSKRVKWVEQQKVLRRSKRDYLDFSDLPSQQDSSNPSSQRRFSTENVPKKNSEVFKLFTDDHWRDQWYLHDTRSNVQTTVKVDLNVIPVWRRNITGRGVVVTVLDDGLELSNPDLAANYDPRASRDLNDNDDDPSPRYDKENSNRHGTRCAGEVAMVANNSFCGVGVAFNAKIGGIRMLDGVVTDLIESKAVSHQLQYVDIFTASWGPTDDGKTMEGPGTLTREAMEKGIKEGRGGKGAIYVWAAGNGGADTDDCACDGYTSNIYTFCISSISESKHSPWYSERCPAVIASTYSSGQLGDKYIVSADLHDKCTTTHSGTSASAPLAAGIFALALEANPDLTWRDLKHLTVWTSEVAPVLDNDGWFQNGAGFFVSNLFGFGVLNADVLVSNAQQWVAVPPMVTCESRNIIRRPRSVRSGDKVTIDITTDACRGTSTEINYLEHVQVYMNMNYSRRGALDIKLTSPSGFKTTLLHVRARDSSEEGIRDWPFTSMQNWGEDPKGTWKLTVGDDVGEDLQGVISSVKFVLHGTTDVPHHVKTAKNNRRNYNWNYNSLKSLRFLNPEERSSLGKRKQAEERNDDSFTLLDSDDYPDYPNR